MSQYSDSQDVDMEAGTANHPDSLSFSTSAVNQSKVPQEFENFSTASGSEDSMTNLQEMILLSGRGFLILFFSFFPDSFQPMLSKKGEEIIGDCGWKSISYLVAYLD